MATLLQTQAIDQGSGDGQLGLMMRKTMAPASPCTARFVPHDPESLRLQRKCVAELPS